MRRKRHQGRMRTLYSSLDGHESNLIASANTIGTCLETPTILAPDRRCRSQEDDYKIPWTGCSDISDMERRFRIHKALFVLRSPPSMSSPDASITGRPAHSLFSRKPITEIDEHKGELKRALNAWHMIALGIGVIIGAGLFSLTGLAAGDYAGPAVVISFMIAAIGCGLAGCCYSELASMIPVAGSAYTYAYATLGELVGWIIGWDLVLEYAVGAATVASSWTSYFKVLLAQFGLALPPRLTASPFSIVELADHSHVHGLINLPAFIVVVAVSVVLMRGVTGSAWLNAVIVMLKLTIVVLVIVLGASYVNTANYVPFIPENTGEFGHFGLSGVMRGAAVIFFSYVGFDAVSTAAQEAYNPQRDVPLGILGSLVICAILYVGFGLVLTGIVNYQELGVMVDKMAPISTAISRTPYEWLKSAIYVGILCGYTTVVLVLLMGQSRVFYSMASDGLLPAIFARVHPQWRTPWLSNLLFMVFAGLMAAFVPGSWLGEATSIGTLLAFILVCIGVMVLRRTDPDRPRRFRTPFVPFVPLVGILFCGAMMLSLDIWTWVRLIVWLIIGLVVFFSYSRKRSLLARHAAMN
ncbi:Amino acid permease [Granulibacter bethesdensis]|nr:Amino acid permease [Granulibacter bethesdensis CGDNIH4]APH59345.1 Amino acid permease [Granulibacter bethesdensis]